MSLADSIAESLLDCSAVKISLDPLFTWTSGIKSPIYCDNRKMISFVKEREVIVDAFIDLIERRGWQPDVIAGTATAAIPWAAFVAQKMALPMVYIRPEKKAHGAGKQIEGDLQAGKRVLIVEDLVSTGGSSVKAAMAVREEGQCEVIAITSIVSYGMGESMENFAEAEVDFKNLVGMNKILDVAVKRGDISDEQIGLVMGFFKDPANWAQKFDL